MKHLLLSVILTATAYAQVPGAGTSGAGTVPGGTSPATGRGETHVSPGGLGDNPAMQEQTSPRTRTGTSPLGPPTMEHPPSPSSGMTRSRGQVTGPGMTSGTHESSNRNPTTGQADDTFGVTPAPEEMNTAPAATPEERYRSEYSDGSTLRASDAYELGPYHDEEVQAEEESGHEVIQQRETESLDAAEEEVIDSGDQSRPRTINPLGPNKR
jgi:hypothetical protein